MSADDLQREPRQPDFLGDAETVIAGTGLHDLAVRADDGGACIALGLGFGAIALAFEAFDQREHVGHEELVDLRRAVHRDVLVPGATGFAQLCHEVAVPCAARDVIAICQKVGDPAVSGGPVNRFWGCERLGGNREGFAPFDPGTEHFDDPGGQVARKLADPPLADGPFAADCHFDVGGIYPDHRLLAEGVQKCALCQSHSRDSFSGPLDDLRSFDMSRASMSGRHILSD